MKKAIIAAILFIGISFSANAQFSIENGSAMWTKTYETDMTCLDILKAMHRSYSFSEIEMIDETFIVAKTKQIPVAAYLHVVAGHDYKDLPDGIRSYHFGPAMAYIQIKEGKYRVEVDNIILSGIISSVKDMRFNSFAVGDDGFSEDFIRYSSIYHSLLNATFTFNKLDENW